MAIIQTLPLSKKYGSMTSSEATAGTKTEGQLISAKVLNDKIDEKISELDSKYISADDTTIIKLNNLNEINLQEDHYNAWLGYRDGKVTNWKFGDGTEGGLANVCANDYYLGNEKLSDKLEEIDDSFSQLDSKYISTDDTTIVKLTNLNEINLQEDHYNAWIGYRGGKVTNWKFGNGTEGDYADVYANDFYLNDESLSDILEDLSVDSQSANYIRYANGLQICWATIELHDLKRNQGYSNEHYFPKPFASAPSVTVNYSSAYSTDTGIAAENIENTHCTFWLKNTVLDVSSFKINYIAIGMWK